MIRVRMTVRNGQEALWVVLRAKIEVSVRQIEVDGQLEAQHGGK